MPPEEAAAASAPPAALVPPDVPLFELDDWPPVEDVATLIVEFPPASCPKTVICELSGGGFFSEQTVTSPGPY